MPVSIKDIARLAGVSHSTVSRALRNSPLIPGRTAERIQQLAKEQGYTASAIGRSLVTRKTQAIGVVVTSIADPFNGDILDGIEQIANERGYSVILSMSKGKADRELAVVRSFQERRVDGIVVASSRVGALYLPVLEELKVPMVLINNQGGNAEVHTVAVDNISGGLLATRHLIELGHRRMAYIGDRTGFQSEKDRFEGCKRALKEAGAGLENVVILEGDGGIDGGIAAGRALAGLKARPTAVFCYNDMTALGLMAEACRCELNVPEELSVVGFDDIVFAGLSTPGLTTVRQPRYEMGALAMRMLLSKMDGMLTEKTVIIPGELIVRGSTAVLRP